ncbi:N-acetylmuramoyl-L-alanine amidase [Streptomyces sp. 4N509B]|uniref:N-acetylmuramoyl-L-alanine amidase n=1 Tax=Streptomyces sp. 4N509B TaxID=3457413 RepID=UPI003FD1F0A2
MTPTPPPPEPLPQQLTRQLTQRVPRRVARRGLLAAAAGLPVLWAGGSAGPSIAADEPDHAAAPERPAAPAVAAPPEIEIAKLVPRSEWNARPRRRPSNPVITPWNGGVAIHYVGGDPVARDDHGDCAEQVRIIQDQHMDDNGWSDIAYTYLVCVHGHVFEGRGPWRRTAANGAGEGNQNWYAICGLVGGVPGTYDPVTPAMVRAIRRTVAALREAGGAGLGINRHGDLSPTDCPGQLAPYVRDGSFDPRR